MNVKPPIYNPTAGFLRLSQVLALIPIGRSTWWKWVADGKAPHPIKLGPNTTAWRTEDILEFVQVLGRVEGVEK